MSHYFLVTDPAPTDPHELAKADRYFICNDDYGIAICRVCAHGIRLHSIVGHLTRNPHYLTKSAALEVFGVMRNAPQWVSVSNNDPVLPDSVEHPIPGMKVSHGFQCTMYPKECCMITAGERSMHDHWRTEHQLNDHILRELTAHDKVGPIRRVTYHEVFWGFTGKKASSILVRQAGAEDGPEAPPVTAMQVAEVVDEPEAPPATAMQVAEAMDDSLADRYFICNDDYGIAICRQCARAIKPRCIVYHLTVGKGHNVKRDVALQVSNIVQNDPKWNSVSHDTPVLPVSIEHPIPGLALQHGFQCTLRPKECRVVLGTMVSMRGHLNTKHRRCARDLKKLAARGKPVTPIRRVACQRVFEDNRGTQFIHIRHPGAAYEHEAPSPMTSQVTETADMSLSALARETQGTQSEPEIHPGTGYEPEAPTPMDMQVAEAVDMSLAAFEQETQSEPDIQPGDIYETNPWVDRTGWATYLRGRKPMELRMCIERPNEDAIGDEGTARVIWDAMLGVARKSQSITKRTGHFVRIEAARTDMAKMPSKPLQEYMKTDDELERHVDSWRRILMIFARTQVRHDWNSPVYRFNKQQRKAWDALWHSAECHKNRPWPIATDGSDANPDALQPVEAYCMVFIIELLNQRIRSTEYESALVCALAVLGVSDHGAGRPWRDPHDFHPILSSVINVSRFIIVHQSFLLDPRAQELLLVGESSLEGEWDDNGPLECSFLDQLDGRSPPAAPTPQAGIAPDYPSGSIESLPSSSASCVAFAQQARYDTKTCLEWIRIMVAAFMVRGTSTPMEWMLEFHQYGIKIHQEAIRLGLNLDGE